MTAWLVVNGSAVVMMIKRQRRGGEMETAGLAGFFFEGAYNYLSFFFSHNRGQAELFIRALTSFKQVRSCFLLARAISQGQ